MRIELIQPFINATDAVLAEMLPGPAQINDVSMDEEVYRRKGVAASVAIRGDIEGRVIFDLESETALRVAGVLAGGTIDPTDQLARETVCELANVIVGNAVTLLNDQGHSFKVYPPCIHDAETGYSGGPESEALVMCFDTPSGKVYLNIALDYSHQRSFSAAESLN
ncbi:MAG TPA: chemotaxis protein CheX [Terriglobia bacterium]|nr:chemotaxis protein CheX [Terriglobia bacterium]